MRTPRLRKDAAQNWQQILDTGRRFLRDGLPLRLNEVAREASVGVATVYRHFPTPEALLEAIALPHLEALGVEAERAVAEEDAWEAFCGFFLAGIEALLADASVQPVFAAEAHALPRAAELIAHLDALAGRVLARAQAAGAVRAELTRADLARLMCGVVYAAGLHANSDQRPALTRKYLDVLLSGLRTGR